MNVKRVFTSFQNIQLFLPPVKQTKNMKTFNHVKPTKRTRSIRETTFYDKCKMKKKKTK